MGHVVSAQSNLRRVADELATTIVREPESVSDAISAVEVWQGIEQLLQDTHQAVALSRAEAIIEWYYKKADALKGGPNE